MVLLFCIVGGNKRLERCDVVEPILEFHYLQINVGQKSLVVIVAAMRPGDITPKVNLMNPLHTDHKARK